MRCLDLRKVPYFATYDVLLCILCTHNFDPNFQETNLSFQLFIYLYFDTCFLYFLKDFIYLFLERGEGREKKMERNISVWLPLAHAWIGDLACNPGMCSDWECNHLVCRVAFNPQSHSSRGCFLYFF